MSEISDKINKMSGTYTPYVIFTDWCKMLALATANACEIRHNSIWQKRESAYLETIRKYNSEQQLEFSWLSSRLFDVYAIEGPFDALGEIYMMAECGNKATGQFFTPFNINLLTARLEDYELNKQIKLNEPSCGAGGMILATARLINEKGGNAQRYLKVKAQDIDWNSVYMTYVQLSYNGIDAIVVQGDTLSDIKDYSEEQIFKTPKNKGVLL